MTSRPNGFDFHFVCFFFLFFFGRIRRIPQVVGFKYVMLFAPSDSPHLYPHEGTMLSNTSRVDVENPDLDAFPDFAKATTARACVLGPGEMLYIPPGHWHYVSDDGDGNEKLGEKRAIFWANSQSLFRPPRFDSRSGLCQ